MAISTDKRMNGDLIDLSVGEDKYTKWYSNLKHIYREAQWIPHVMRLFNIDGCTEYRKQIFVNSKSFDLEVVFTCWIMKFSQI